MIDHMWIIANSMAYKWNVYRSDKVCLYTLNGLQERTVVRWADGNSKSNNSFDLDCRNISLDERKIDNE